MRSTWTTRTPLSEEEANAFSDLATVFSLDGDRVTNGSRSSVIRVCLGGRTYYVKRYESRRRDWFRAPERCWPDLERRNLSLFSELGIPTPEIVATGSERRFAKFVRGAIVTEAVPRSETLRTLTSRASETPLSAELQHRIIEKLADYVRRIHSVGFVHRDLKWRNILIQDGDGAELYFIDCPCGGVLPKFAREHFIIKELANLDRLATGCISRSMRLRFLRKYFGGSKLRGRDKALIRRIIRREAKRASRASG